MFSVTPELLWDGLSKQVNAQYFGVLKKHRLKVPIFFTGTQILEEKRVYVTSTEYLPEEPQFTKSMLLVCVGEIPSWSYTKGYFPVIWIENGEATEILNIIQEIFDMYNSWACSLDNIINNDADIIKMVKVSLPIFGNPIAVLDRDMYHLALTDYTAASDISKCEVRRTAVLSSERAAEFNLAIGRYGNAKDIYSPREGTISKNIFISGRREVSVTLGEIFKPLDESDRIRLEFFVDKLTAAYKQRAKLAASHSQMINQVFYDLIVKKPVSKSRMLHMQKRYGLQNNKPYICLTLRPPTGKMDIPVEYYCVSIENMFSSCVAMEYDESLVIILGLNEDSTMNIKDRNLLENFLVECNLQAGVSDVFNNLRYLRTAYRQACNAYEIGIELRPGSTFYSFKQFVLPYMLLHSTGEFTVKAIIPHELWLLKEKSENTDVDYWGTLDVYLRNNMNIAQTSRDLFLHRSSLLGRLERIYEVLGHRLEDPLIQLQYRMIMQLYDINSSISGD